MELRELRSFCTAARFKSMSKAAEHLRLGQPTVSMHIKRLEEELGIALFDRIRRPIQLTSSGKTLAELATPLVDGIDGLAATASEAEQHSPVTVASTPDIIPHTLLGVVRAFVAEHPHVQLRVRAGTRPEVLRLVEDGEVDMGIVPGAESGVVFEFEGLFVYERVLITPPNHPLLQEPVPSLEQIARWPLILMRRGSHTRTLLEAEFRRRSLDYEVVIELDSMDMIKRYVALGIGVSVGPRLAIEPEDQGALGIVSLATILPVEQAGVVTLRGKTLSTTSQDFVSVFRDTVIPSDAGRTAGTRGR